MYKYLGIVAVVLALGLSVSPVMAQCGCGVSYAPAYTAYYAPTVAYYAPVESYVSYYAPACNSCAAPACTSCAAPAAPACTSCSGAAPAYTTYYAPAAYTYSAYYAPAAPAYVSYYYGTPGWSVYGTPKVYQPGQPVRNVLRAVTW